ncbi:MAG: peptidoglycan-associated lipoprotein Pal [Pseudomonadota bacterium]
MTLMKPIAALMLAVLLAACAQEAPEEAAAPVAPAVGSPLDPASIEFFRAEVGDRVLFATDSSRLDAVAQATLGRQAAWLLDNPARNATIEGHADERGTREYNLALGARRAAAVRAFLVAEGVPAARLRTVTFGKERPESLCSNESCWSQNRRGVTVMATAPTS